MSVVSVVGARPNFMKMAPVIHALARRGVSQTFVHTGQHYDDNMSKVFFDELHMPVPDVYLGVGSGTHAEQTAKVMVGFEQLLMQRRPRLVVVAGDVNSTLACALTAAKLCIPVAHVESGLRSMDRAMPEEINRVLTDHVSALLFVTEPAGLENLRREGISGGHVQLVGNSMIDTLVQHRAAAAARAPWQEYGLSEGGFALLTLHRPSNVDDPSTAQRIADGVRAIAREVPVLFPIHPRTVTRTGDLWRAVDGVRLVEPLGYLDFLGLMGAARVVLTDSGGIQEETTALGVPCITVRKNTERPVTIEQGTNRLVDPDATAILQAWRAGPRPDARVPALWDGQAGERIVDGVMAFLSTGSGAA